MKKVIFVFTALFTTFISCKQEKKETLKTETTNHNITEVSPDITSEFSIEIIDKEALTVINPEAKIEILASGFTWTEGPLWIEKGNYLLFSDIPNNKVYKLNAKNDSITYLKPSGCDIQNFTGKESGSNGLTLSPDGKLVLMQQGDRRIGIMDAPLDNPEPKYITIVDNYKGKRLNSPNDASYDAFGNLYFTDPPYGLPGNLEDPNKELDFQGVYCLLKNGELILLDDQLKYPNGIVVSNDGKRLYVAVSNREKASWYTYDIVAPGNVENKKVLHDVTALVTSDGHQGLPDGLKINKKGIVFATGPNGVWVFNANDKLIARIHTGQLTANCALNTKENRLYMTADDYILAVDLH